MQVGIMKQAEWSFLNRASATAAVQIASKPTP
jgi:hypothetical protein